MDQSENEVQIIDEEKFYILFYFALTEKFQVWNLPPSL